jgi:hypothetical protein
MKQHEKQPAIRIATGNKPLKDKALAVPFFLD